MTTPRHVPLAIAALLWCGAGTAPAQSGSESPPGTSEDLECAIDDRWVGGQRGGYWPVRIALTNRGAARSITAAYVPYESRRRGGGRAPLVTRTLALPAGASTRFTLPVPLTSTRADGELVIVADPLAADGAVAPDPRDAEELLAAAVPGLTREVHPPGADSNAVRGPSTLVLEGTPFELKKFLSASSRRIAEVESIADRSPARRTSAGYGTDGRALPATALPENWLGLVAVDLIVADGPRLASLTEGQAGALRDWLAAGGALAVTNATTDPAEPLPEDARRALHLDGSGTAWRAVTGDDIGGAGTAGGGDGGRRPRRLLILDGESSRSARPGPPIGPAPRRRAALGGRIYALPVGGGGEEDWYAVLGDLAPDRLTVADRFGVGGRGPNREFVEFLIPGVRGVPVGTLVALITLFVVAIGPVNYLILRRRHQVGRLALTVPLIAAVTAGTLLAYSTVMHGFGTKVRQLAVTVHDPATDRAVEFARTAVFAPHTPEGGLTFGAETAVLPLAPPGPNAGGGRVDWTAGQTWSGDAFRGRTRTQFVTVTPRPERGRLTVEWAGDIPTAVNGYAHDFALLVLSDDEGRVYHGAEVPAGGAASLRPITGDDLFTWRSRLDDLLPAPPPGIEENPSDLLDAFPMLHSADDSNASFEPSLAFRTAASFRSLNERGRPIEAFEAAPLVPEPRGAFVALLAEPSLTEFGGGPVDARGGAHLLIGRPESGREPAAAAPGAAISVRRPGGGR